MELQETNSLYSISGRSVHRSINQWRWCGRLITLTLLLVILVQFTPTVRPQMKGKETAKKEIVTTSVNGIFPASVKSGSVVKAEIGGSRLDGATGFWCEHPGITAKILPEAASTTTVKAEINVAANVPSGLYEWRLFAERGASAPRFLAVGNVEEALEVEPNDALDKANPIPLEGGVNGNVNDSKDVDTYQFTAKKGDRQFVMLQSRIFGVADVMAVAVIDKDGKPLSLGTTYYRGDPYADFTAAADGTYYAQVWTLGAGEKAGRNYRITVTKKAIIDYVYPAGGQRGKQTDLEVGLKNPAAANTADTAISVVRQPWQVPAQSEKIVAFRLDQPATVGNATLFASDLPNINENEPNDTAAEAMPITVPTVLHGRFPSRGDVDYFRFQAEKDKKLIIESNCRALGSKGDLVLAVQDKAGKILAQNPDNLADRTDPVVEFVPPESGEYILKVSDLIPRRCNSPKFQYRLVIRPPMPDFSLTVESPTLFSKPGEGGILVSIQRQDSFESPVAISITGLPNDITVTPGMINPGENSVFVSLKIPESRNNQHFPIQVRGKATVGMKEVVRTASVRVRLIEDDPTDAGFVTENLALSVTTRDLGPPPPPLGVGTIAASSDGWRYIDAAEVKGTDWMKLDFKDNNWKAAKAPLGYGEDAIAAKKGTNITITGKPFFIRRTFELDDKILKPGVKFELKVASDNSAVVWINGKKVDEDNEDHEPEYWNRTVNVPENVFVKGKNIIAVQINNTDGSSDAFFDAQLDALVPAIPKK
ncbi:MAG: PPC domain-containing protein [Zavarzinella sp.]